jgi:hypothetical protein
MKRLAAILLVAACGGGSDSPDAGGGPDAAIGDVTPLVGTFTVSLVPSVAGAPPYSSMLGKVYDGPQPEAIQWMTAATANGCTLVTPKVPFCSTPCGGSAVCVADNTCKPYATGQPLGTITATGLATQDGAASFTMDPVANAYQPPSTVKLAYPAYREGEKFELVTSGSAFAPSFTVGARGVAALDLTTTPISLALNTALPLAWTAPAVMGSTIHIKLDISHHGGSKGKLECDLPDTGSTTIDAGLITQLLNLGAAGYPTIIVTRSRTGSAAVTAGRIDLVAASTVEKPVNVPGITSCTDTSECPQGQTCQPDLTCR